MNSNRPVKGIGVKGRKPLSSSKQHARPKKAHSTPTKLQQQRKMSTTSIPHDVLQHQPHKQQQHKSHQYPTSKHSLQYHQPSHTPLLRQTRRKFSQYDTDRPLTEEEHKRMKSFIPTEAPQGYIESVELGTEYIDLPDDERDQNLHTNLSSLLKEQYNFGFKPYAQVLNTNTQSTFQPKALTPLMFSTEDLERKLQREQTMDDAIARQEIMKMQQQDDLAFKLREAESMSQHSHENEAETQRRSSILRPIRHMIPPQVQKLTKALVNEARSRNLDEHGKRPLEPLPGSDDPVYDDEGKLHDSAQIVLIDGKECVLSQLSDKQVIGEIIRITIEWNRSGPRTRALAGTDLSYSNKAKLEEGVSPYFSADKERDGRQFSYQKLLDEVEKIQHENETTQQKKNTLNNDNTKKDDVNTTSQKVSQTDAKSTQGPPQHTFKPLTSLDNYDDDGDMEIDIGSTLPKLQKNMLPPLPSAGIAAPTINTADLIKSTSPFKELTVEKPQVSLNDKIAGSSRELADQLIHRDFLHNSIIRRKPRGKLTELETRDALVDHERAHSLDTLFKHYEISMLSLFEEVGNAQSISTAADVIGGFSPVFLKVKTDFDPSFIQMIKLLHEQQRLTEEAAELSNNIDAPSFGGITDPFGQNAMTNKNNDQIRLKAQQEAERKHVEFLNRLITTDKDGCSTLHKDDVLIPDFPDSVIEILLSETLDKQVTADGTYDVSASMRKNINKPDDENDTADRSADRLDHSMRDSMMEEMLRFKGKTIGQLHEMGCFNRNPYDDVEQTEYKPGAARNEFDEGGQRNRYGFTDEMKHMHRFTTEDEFKQHRKSTFGGQAAEEGRDEYLDRMDQKAHRIDEAAQKRTKVPLMMETDSFIRHAKEADDNAKTRSLYEKKQNGENEYGLSAVSRFSQLAMASAVISKYGSLDESYRRATGLDMNKIDELIIDALEQGDVYVNKMPKDERQAYLSKLKQDALIFPKLAFESMAEHTHVPYMTTGVFSKLPSRFFGAWDYETALNARYLHKIGINNHSLTPLGPYHPMFLVTVGGRGFTQENAFDVSELRTMLRGDIDERPDVLARRTAAWVKRNPGKDPLVEKPFQFRDSFVFATDAHLSRSKDPLEYLEEGGYSDLEDDQLANARLYRQPQQNNQQQQKVQPQKQQKQQVPTPDVNNDPSPVDFSQPQQQQQQQSQQLSFEQQAAERALKLLKLNEIEEIVDEEDEAKIDNKYDTAKTEETAPVSDPVGHSRPQLPRNYPQMQPTTESFDPNEIVFNTGNMTEFHKTHEVNQIDIKDTAEQLLTGAELTYKFAKEEESRAKSVDGWDKSHELRLRHFVDTDYQKSKEKKVAEEVHGDFSGIARSLHDAKIVSYDGETVTDRAKPNPFKPDAPKEVKIEINNPQHELFGGPITVQHFLSSMVETDEGKNIANVIEAEHRQFLGDEVYEESIKSSQTVNKKAPLQQEPNGYKM